MLLTKCSECSKDVSTRAIACPHCGCPLTLAQDKVAPSLSQTANAKMGKAKLPKGVKVACFGILAVFGVIILAPVLAPKVQNVTPTAEVIVSNVTIAQRPKTKLVDITYDISCAQTKPVRVSLTVSTGTEKVNATHLTGDVGWPVFVGTGKLIVWDAGADWDGNSALDFNLVVEVPPVGMTVIPAGTNSGTNPDFGTYYSLSATNSFYMDVTEVTKAQWDAVYSWALSKGYRFDNAGSGKVANHPVQNVNWYDAVKWCNAHSEKDGRTPCYTVEGRVYKIGQNENVSCDFSADGYRLPNVFEWSYAARGGLSSKRFPWGNAISHNNANYHSFNTPTGFHPDYAKGNPPYTSPVGVFPANGYGLYDMYGNVWEWCWDIGAIQNNSDTFRCFRGGSWNIGGGEPHVRFGSTATCMRLPRLGGNDCGFRTVCR
jgi:hypothetical protein